MPPGVSDRSLIQYIKHIDDTKNKAHIILYKNFPGDHPNAPDMSGTVRWVRGGVTREYISVTDMHSHVVYAHVHTHTHACTHMHTHCTLKLFDPAELKQSSLESSFDQMLTVLIPAD